VRRLVFFDTRQLSSDERAILVVDVSPGARLTVKNGWRNLDLDNAELLCPLDSSNKVDFEWKMEVETVAGRRRPVHDSFEIRDIELLTKPPGELDRLQNLISDANQANIPPLEHNGFRSSVLEDATRLRLPEFLPPQCADDPVRHNTRHKTTVVFRRVSDFDFHTPPTPSELKVITFEFETQDRSKCASPPSRVGRVRTFWGDDGFEYADGELPSATHKWKFVFRPRYSVSVSAPGPELARGARWVLHVHGLPTRTVAASWNRLVSAFHLFLRGTQGKKDVSFLPQLNDIPATPPAEQVGWWTMSYELIDARTDDRTIFLDGDRQDDPTRIAIRPLALHFGERLSAPAGAPPVLKGAVLPQVLMITGAPLSHVNFILADASEDARKKDAENGDRQGIFLNVNEAAEVCEAVGPGEVCTPGGPGDAKTVRVGALDLEFGRSRATQTGQNHLRLAPSGQLVTVDVDAKFFIKGIAPGGQDYSASEELVATTEAQDIAACVRPKPPVVISLSGGDSNPRLLLRVRQTYGVDPNPPHQLTLDILSQTGRTSGASANVCASPDRVVVVLDRNPFLVAEVRYTAFDRLSSFAGNKIATWSSGGAVTRWDLLFEEQPFCLVMPPQAVGEEMIKGTKLEQDVGANALPFNLGPPTEMVVDSRQVRTNFAEAPWNLRRILGTRGEPLAGPLVRRLRYELLYGLSGDVDKPGIRLADVFSQAGRIASLPLKVMAWVGTDAQIKAYDDSRKAWAVAYSRYLARAAVLVPWNSILLDPDRPPVVLSESRSMRLRLPPLSNMKSPVDTDAADGTLRGGATWGFESKNIYQAVIDNQPSSSARLENFSFSALGGWGKQHANFQNDLTRISADVSMGRAFHYQVERLGRIACFWPLAKHVVVYERSVVPSRQFNDPAQPLSGWPVLRKVKEYVELLDEKHAFPDDPQAKATDATRRASGFVTNCTFQPGDRFNVHGSWGSDVGNFGWKIPIWRPGQQPADLYPKPDISLGLATNLKGEQNDQQCDVDNPDNFYFFTLTRDPRTGAEPDRDPRKWPSILDVDYVNAPRPRREEALQDLGEAAHADFNDGDPRASTPADSPVPPLYGPCTFRLKPSAVPADVVAERTEKALAAVIQTVTLVRSVEANAANAPQWPDDLKVVRRLEVGVTQLFNRLLKDLPMDAVPTPAHVAQLADRVRSDFADLQTKLTNARTNVNNLKANLTARIRQAEDAIRDRLREQFAGDGSPNGLGRRFRDALGELRTRVEQFPDAPFDVEKAKRLLVEHQHQIEELFLLVTSLPGVVTELLARYVDLVVELASRVEEGLKRADDALAAGPVLIQQELDAGLREVQRKLDAGQITLQQADAERRELQERARAAVEALVPQARKEMTALIQRARETVDAFNTIGLTRPLPFLPDPTPAVRAKLAPYFDPERLKTAADRLLEDMRVAPNVAAARAAIATFRASPFFTTLQNRDALRDFIREAFGQTVDFSSRDAAKQILKAVHFAQFWRDDETDGLLNKWRLTVMNAAATVQTSKAQLLAAQRRLNDWLTDPSVAGGLQTQLDTLVAEINSRIAAAAAKILESLDATIAGLDWASVQRELNNILGQPAAEIESKLKELRDRLTERGRRYFEQAASLKPDLPAFQVADQTLRLIRAFGDPPRVPKLDFDRPQVAYFFKEALPEVDLTPVAALATQAASLGEKLKPLGVRLPTRQAVEQFIPVDLSKFDLSRVFPSFAGLDLRNLFSGIKLDNVGSDNVKITHGLDEQTRRAFVRADVNFRLEKEATLFTLGPLTLRLASADFQATSIIEGGPGSEVRRKVFGRIKGAWELVLSGIVLLRFKDTELRFDDASGVKFSISPRSIELPQILSFLSDLVNIAGGDGASGLTIGLLPNGVQSVLSLPLPDVQAGAFGISNLRLSAILALQFDDEFTISLGFGLGRRDAPFSLTIFILGGGGSFEVRATYFTRTRRLTCGVALVVTVSASLAIALGPIKGGVYVYFGITATYRNGSGLAIGVLLLMRGEVSVLGIVSASISLLLEASYNTQTKAITGVGRLSIKIKICWCFTLEVEHELTYTLGKSGDRARLDQPEPAPRGGAHFVNASWDGRRLAAGGDGDPASAVDIFDTIAHNYISLLV